MSGADFAQQANIAQQAHKAGSKGTSIDVNSNFGRNAEGATTIMHGGTPDYIANGAQSAGGGGDSSAASGGGGGGGDSSAAAGAGLASAGVTAQGMANVNNISMGGGAGLWTGRMAASPGDDGGRGM